MQRVRSYVMNILSDILIARDFKHQDPGNKKIKCDERKSDILISATRLCTPHYSTTHDLK